MFSSEILKAALISYFRFERKWVVATEVNYSTFGGIADILVAGDNEIIEVETKVDNVDMTELELTKQKHDLMQHMEGFEHDFPNKFYLCVPYTMRRGAEQLIEKVNPKYGLIILPPVEEIQARSLKIVKHAAPLHTYYNKEFEQKIILRLCSEIANMYEKKANALLNPNKETFSKDRLMREGRNENPKSKKQQYRRPNNSHLRNTTVETDDQQI
jgi:hypothetical protein